MRKFLILIAGVSLCAISYAQSVQLSDQPPADTQPAASQPQQPSLGDYARQLRLKKQQHEAQLQQAKEAKENQAKEDQANENPAQETTDKQTPTPAAQVSDAKPEPQTPQASPAPVTAAMPHVEQMPTVTPAAQPVPQPKPQIVTSAAVPARATVTTASVRQTVPPADQSLPIPTEAQIRQWKGEIQQQKSLVASLQKDIADLNNSIHLAGGNCIANCEQWNDRQKQKKQDLDTLKAQLQEQQGILAEMLEAERVLIPASARSSQ